ncbi:MAG TPA: proline racemase family protein, partial [Kiloniellaceae bacterium]|nr:proline racemase family protein [Kiloniellaceae bacterium]
GKVDRSPTGTAVSARMAVLHAKGELAVGGRFLARSIIDSQFEGRIVERAKVGALDAIVPSITGRAWITGTHQLMLDPEDPWPGGYRIGDTWPLPGSDEA